MQNGECGISSRRVMGAQHTSVLWSRCLLLAHPVPEGSGHCACPRLEMQMFPHWFYSEPKHAKAWGFLPKRGLPKQSGSVSAKGFKKHQKMLVCGTQRYDTTP